MLARFAAASRHDRHTVLDRELIDRSVRIARLQLRSEVAHVPHVPHDFRARVNVDAAMRPHAIHQIAQQPLRIVTFGHVIQVIEIPAQHLGAFDEVHVVAAVGDGERGRHARHPAADDQGCRLAQILVFVDRPRGQHPPHGHAHQLLRFAIGEFGLLPVHPRALLAQIDQFQQIRIQPRHAHHAVEQGFVRAIAARGNHDVVEIGVDDALLQTRDGFGEAGEVHDFTGRPRWATARHAGSALRDRSPPRSSIRTSRRTRPRAALRFRDIALGRQTIGGEERPLARIDVRAELIVQQAHHFGGGAARVDDGLDDFFRRRERAAHEHAGARRLERREFVGFTEAVGLS